MLASARLARPNVTRRAAFTLVEVLVVVAIVVILASVGTIATLKFLEDAKIDNARMTAQVIVDTAKANEAKLDGVDFTQSGLGMLSPYLDKGDAGLLDPWNQPYQVRYVQIQSQYTSSSSMRIYVYTHHPKTGQEIGWPKEFEPAHQQ
jgi:general secretion pathway protein G